MSTMHFNTNSDDIWYSADSPNAWIPIPGPIKTSSTAASVPSVLSAKTQPQLKPPNPKAVKQSITTTTTTTTISPPISPRKEDLKQQKQKKSNNDNNNKTVEILPPPPYTSSLKFHQLPPDGDQTDWENYVTKEEHIPNVPKTSSVILPPPNFAPEDFSTNWDISPRTKERDSNTSTITSATTVAPTAPEPAPTTATGTLPYSTKQKRNCEIEAELVRQNLYKTELCSSWTETGTCRYGSKCQFAHGRDELRPVMRHPKYKTETCKTFHTTGQCPYGKRCRFIHQLDEFRSKQDTDIDDMDNNNLGINTANALNRDGNCSNGISNSNSSNSKLAAAMFAEDEEEITTTAELQRRFKELNLTLLSTDPVVVMFPPVTESGTVAAAAVVEQAKKSGSRLPFFQKLRKQKW